MIVSRKYVGAVIFFSCSFFSNLHLLADNLHYFKNTYEDSEQHFIAQFSKIKKTSPQATSHQFQYAAGTIRSYFFPAKKKQKSLLVLISGTHGIEAFAGSAVQRWLLDQNYNTNNTAILMIHGFNLYGFKNFRRVNEHNIDLNRNFVLARSKFQADDKNYAQLNTFLNPSSAPELNFFSRFTFLIRAVFNIAQHSLESLRSAVLKGQYTYPEGIFYGGARSAAQSILITDLIQTFMLPYQKIFLIDLHTGYGEKGRLHLLAGKSDDDNSLQLLKIFNNDEIDFADKKMFYTTQGDLLTYFINKIKLKVAAEISGIVFEYGTLDSQKTLGSIESLRRVVLENQNFHYPTSSKTSAAIKSLYQEMFYPSDQAWRAAVLQQSEAKMQKVFSYLMN